MGICESNNNKAEQLKTTEKNLEIEQKKKKKR